MSSNFSRLRTSSIRSHLSVLALGTLLPVVLFAAALAVVQARQERQTFERGMHDRVLAITSAIDAELRATVGSLRTLTQIQSLSVGDLDRFHGVAQRVKNLNPEWVAVTLAGADGLLLLDTLLPYGTPVLPLAETASLEEVLRTLQPAIGSLSSAQRSSRQTFPVRVPVLREGRLTYVLSAVVDPVAFSRILRDQGLPEDWVVSLVDLRLLQVARLYQGKVQVGVTVAPAFSSALTSGATEGAYRGVTLEGTPAYVTWRRSTYSRWSVGIAVPVKSVEASAWRALVIGLLGVGASLALALALARLLARRISEPVAMLEAQARGLRSDYNSSLQHPQPGGPILLPSRHHPAPTNVTRRVDEEPNGASVDMWELRELQHALDHAARAMDALGRARAQAESDNRAKDEFLAMLGHELRNPLSAIANAAQVLRIRSDGPPAVMALGVLERQITHLTKLIDDLLDASRVSQGKIQLERRPLDFAALVRRVAVQILGSSQKHPLHLRLETAWVSGDDTRLEQIVTNLLMNAVRYSPDGGAVQLALTRAGARVVLSVRDEGVGMAADLVPRVFDLFVQGLRGAARTQGGLGIGLTLAHRLTELHGGRLEALSEGEGQGSTFILTLPGIDPPPDSESAKLPANPGSVRRLDVLLVEDNDDGRRMLREVLEAAGHRVSEAVDGPEALERAAAGSFDVALIDIGLPGLDGLEVARRLRRLGPQHTTSLLVAISGYGAPQDHARSLEAGFDLHLVKPVDSVDLLEQVQRLLRQAQ